MTLKNTLKFEEFAMFILGFLGFLYFGGTWFLFLLMLLLPDLGMIGYVINPVVGAYTYNILHHKGLGILLFIVGVFLKIDVFIFIGIILFSHSSMDRALGYGLKYKNSFNNTHLGEIGAKK